MENELETLKAGAAPGSVAIVVPVFNEAEVVQELVGRIDELAREDRRFRELVIVDDHSDDETLAVLLQICRERPLAVEVKIFQLARRAGQDRAIRVGLRQCTSECVVVSDADLQYDPGDFPLLLERLSDSVHAVFAMRRRLAFSWLHRALRRCYVLLAGVFFGHKAYTEKCVALSAAGRDAILSRSRRFPYLPLDILHAVYPVEEVTVEHYPRFAGRSKVGLVEHVLRGLGLITLYGRLRWNVFWTSFAGLAMAGGQSELVILSGLPLAAGNLWPLAVRPPKTEIRERIEFSAHQEAATGSVDT